MVLDALRAGDTVEIADEQGKLAVFASSRLTEPSDGDNVLGIYLAPEIAGAHAEGRLREDVDWRIAMTRSQLHAMPEGPRKALYEWVEPRKAQVRVIVEHPFHVIKNLFSCRKVSYYGIAKNQARAKAHVALANLYIAGRRLMAQGVSASTSFSEGGQAASNCCESARRNPLCTHTGALNTRRRQNGRHEAR